ncbi:putative transporter [Lasiodiplodia hormozganensis]|uniref:Transporter n=1 Tax=Lasiodiplodia hormozganensis TaxID=869390 RepID=A0AA40D1S7_9PEZI|nr:putative transporter [Lasiodiplodia hormozganensis]
MNNSSAHSAPNKARPAPSSSLHPNRPLRSQPHQLPPDSSPSLGSSPVVLSPRQPSRSPSPFVSITSGAVHRHPPHAHHGSDDNKQLNEGRDPPSAAAPDSDLGFEDWELGNGDDDHHRRSSRDSIADDDDDDMPSDLRPPFHRPTDGRSHQPLLGNKRDDRRSYDSPPLRPQMGARRRTFHERDPDLEAKTATRKRYTYAAGFLVLSLISFAVQTETAVYIQHHLGWNKAYSMLWLTHGSWSLLWPTQLLILRIQKWNQPWPAFWRRHVQILRSTAQMVEHGTLRPTGRQTSKSPVPYMLKMTAIVTCALTVAGGSWYVAVDLTTASDLTAIYNCSAFFAYAFSIPLLHEKVRASKIVAVAIAIVGVLVVAYGDVTPAKHGNKSGGGAGGGKAPQPSEASNRALGNIIIGIGSVLYGLYEVLYKKLACPPDGCSPGRGMIFANTFGSLIGCFTLFILWIPIPILHYSGIEKFALPTGEAAWMLAISVLANATFSGSFLVLISLTSPVLSSVAALLTIFIVALIDQLLPPPLNSPLSFAAVIGGCLIIGAFLMLSYDTYKEMDEERRKKLEEDVSDSDVDSRMGD